MYQKNYTINFSNILTFFIVTFPISKIYATKIPGVSFGELLILFSIILCFLFRQKTTLRVPKTYIFFYLYMILITPTLFFVMPYLNISSYIHSFLSLTLASLIIILGSYYINIYFALKLLKTTTILVVAFFFMQSIIKLAFNYTIVGIVPFIPLSNGVESSLFIQHQIEVGRFSSFFEEPSHLAQFLLIGLLFSLFSEYKYFYKNMKLALVITLALLLSLSGNAIVVIFLSWGMFFINKLIQENIKYKIIYIISICIVISLLVLLFLLNETLFNLLNRTEEISGNGSTGLSSGYIRIVRGYELIKEFNLIEFLFGIGSQNIEMYVNLNPNTNYISIIDKQITWVNGFQNILISGGIIGVLLYISFLRKYYIGNSIVSKSLIVSMFILSFLSEMYNNAIWIVICIIIISLYYKKNKLKWSINEK